MPDIFISYSSKDRERAQMLTEMLTSAGLSVWIDQSGIGAATSWSGEISKAITECKALIVLLSPSSVDSKNVTREVALAFERNKKILPIDIEPVALPDDFAYHLAGLQRSSMTNIDAIIRALGKLGLEATGAPQAPKIVKETDARKSLMILPFEDLSPTGDNGWFADGIVTELIGALSNVKTLRVTDQQTTKEFKSYTGSLTAYAREMGIRYFVQGSVRKFGDQIKIAVSLLDIESGDHLWHDAIKATMSDIFEVQETVANNVVDALKLHLSSDEKQKLAKRGTENAEAYELYLKAIEYFARQTKEAAQIAIQLVSEAIRLDPNYANAYEYKARTLTLLYRSYDRNPALLAEAEALCHEALRLNPDFAEVHHPLSVIYMHQGKLAKAEAAAKEFIRVAPEKVSSHFALGFFYACTGQTAKAIAPFEAALRIQPDHRATTFNLVVNCDTSKEVEKCRRYALAGLPIEERHLRLHPDDEATRIQYAILLQCAGRSEDAKRESLILKNAKDGGILYNTASLFGALGDKKEALATFRRAIEAGYKDIRLLKEFLKEDIEELKDTQEYAEVKQIVEQIEAEVTPNA